MALRAAISRAFLTGLAGMLLCAGLARAADDVDVAAAKREGKVVWYTAAPPDIAQQLAQMFEAETGVTVELFRSGGSAIMRRFMQERDGGRTAVDVLYTGDPVAMDALARKDMLVPFKPKNFDRLQETSRHPAGYYTALRLNVVTLFVRTDKVAPADVPKAWPDLADARYAGKMVIADPSFSAAQVPVVAMLAHRLGWSYFEALRRNDTMVVQGNQQLADVLKRNERVIAAGGHDSYAFAARKAGHPVANVFPADGTFAIAGPVAVVKGSPNPNAARLLAEFLIGDAAQKLIVAGGAFSPRFDMPAPEGAPALKDIKLLPIDAELVEKQATAVKKKFNEVFQ
jgi:iron(III) transport system substrate-binding protein